MKRRLDICGREKNWEYLIEAAGRQYQVSVRQMGRGEPEFTCTCGASSGEADHEPVFFGDPFGGTCTHIAEAQRDLSIARQAAAQMIP
jgi:hypothetical protein